ncbi:MAG: DUF6249 domain-containing protein [bacterium]|nr:DUF6249 domain-containing protein [bacterium]
MPKSDTSTSAQSDSAVAQLKKEYELTATHKFQLDSMTLANRAAVAEFELRNETHTIEPIIAVFIPVIAIVGGLFVAYKAIEANRAVKLALIEKGLDAAFLAEPVNENSKKYGALRYGLLLGGIGLGLIAGVIINAAFYLDDRGSEWVTGGTAALFGGIGMVAYHLMVKRSELKQ